MLRVLFDLINGASAQELEVIVPPDERADISCQFIVDYGTSGRLRLIAKKLAKEAARKGQAQQLYEAWMRRLAKKATTAMLSFSKMPEPKNRAQAAPLPARRSAHPLGRR